MLELHIESLFRIESVEFMEYLKNCSFQNKIMGGIEKTELEVG